MANADAVMEKEAAELEKLAAEEEAAGRITARGFMDELHKMAEAKDVGLAGLAGGAGVGATAAAILSLLTKGKAGKKILAGAGLGGATGLAAASKGGEAVHDATQAVKSKARSMSYDLGNLGLKAKKAVS